MNRKTLETLSKHSPKSSIISNSDLSIILVRSFFSATEGELDAGSYLKLGVCMSGGGQVQYCSDNRSKVWHWGRNDILVTAPHDNAQFSSPDANMVGLAVETKSLFTYSSPSEAKKGINKLSTSVIRDEVISSIIVALWTSAEYHGPSSAFIDEGVSIILKRILTADKQVQSSPYVRPLNSRQLGKLTEYINEHLSEDIRIPELAAIIGMEPRRFSRAIRAATGIAPYKYLVNLRMQVAKQKISDGKSIIDTALLVGYQNPGKFSSAFRRTVGCTPSEWQRKNSA